MMENKESRVDKIYNMLYGYSESFRKMSLDMQGMVSMDLAKLQEWHEKRDMERG